MDSVEKQRNYELAEKLLSEQNFTAAVIVGAVATILAAAFYSITIARWNFSYGFAAAGIGIAVGISMQFLGRGIETKFAVVAAVYTIAGCALGNMFKVVMDKPFLKLTGWSVSYVSFVELFFWFVAVWFAVFLVKRPLSRSDKLAIGMYKLKG